MLLFPRAPKKFISINDENGNIVVYDTGLSLPYQRGVYYADRYSDILTYQLETGEKVGPAPVKPISSPEDVVVPSGMLPSDEPPAPPSQEGGNSQSPPPAEEEEDGPPPAP